LAAAKLADQNQTDSGNPRRTGGRIHALLGLTDEQATKLQATHSRFAQQRREDVARRRAIVEALWGQLRPGIAANADSVRKLLDAREQNRDAFARLQRDEENAMAGYLTAVQGSRY